MSSLPWPSSVGQAPPDTPKSQAEPDLQRRGETKWLFSAPVDLATFLGSAVVSLIALAVGAHLGWLNGAKTDTPEWTWVVGVLLVDVAHVWATGFRVYFDPREFRRRPGLYLAVPALGLALGVALYDQGETVFWRVLAYVAVFHFIRQQYGWVMLYRAKAGERDRRGRWLDTITIYLATLYPLVWWHAHLPRRFWWFLKNDFATTVPAAVEQILAPIYWLALAAYFSRSLYRWLALGRTNPGKDIVVATTAVCWYVGIIALNSDYAFTVTNVFIHGVPYLVLIYWYRWARRPTDAPRGGHLRTVVLFLGLLWFVAYAEELLWDRCVWHERDWLFGIGWSAEPWKWLLVPLLALPQMTHYLLDGFIWRRRSNPGFTLAETAART